MNNLLYDELLRFDKVRLGKVTLGNTRLEIRMGYLIGLVSELSSECLVVLLLAEFILEGLVTLGNQGLDLTPLRFDVLKDFNFIMFW
jgi:hypothetical protein